MFRGCVGLLSPILSWLFVTYLSWECGAVQWSNKGMSGEGSRLPGSVKLVCHQKEIRREVLAEDRLALIERL